MTAINAGARLDRIPVSRFHYQLFGLIAGGMFLDGFEIYLVGGVLAALVASGWSTAAMNATFISFTFAGMLLGAWFAGVTGDRFGRRFAYQTNLLVFGLASFAAAAAPSMAWLIGARFIMGLGLGAEVVVGYVMINEFVPPRSRGKWGTGLAVVTNSALFVSAAAGRAIIPNYGWRWMFVIVGAGALIVWFLRRKMPESPRWLESKGRLDEAEKVLASIETQTGVTDAPKGPVLIENKPMVSPPLTALFGSGVLMRTLIACVLMVTMNTATIAFLSFLPTFMVRQGLSVVTSLNYTTLMSLGGPVGALMGAWLSDRLGRKPCIVVFSVLALIFGAIYPTITTPGLLPWVGFAMVTAVYVLIAISYGVYVPEMFPTGIRMRGVGFANTIGRFATIFTPQIAVVLFESTGVAGVLGMVGVLMVLQIVLVAGFGIETRQRSLESLSPGKLEQAV